MCFEKSSYAKDSSFVKAQETLRDNFPVDGKAGSYFSSQDKAPAGLHILLRAAFGMVA